MEENTKKKVDETWKEQVEKEKQQAQSAHDAYHEPNFSLFVSSLSMQAMIAMGKLENPITKQTEKNLEQARYLIDTLDILKTKTIGNLVPEEQKMLDEALYNLRMIYVEERK